MKSTDIPASVRRLVQDRDLGACRGCGKSEMLQIHHIHYRSQERNNHTLENLISLCYKCHRLAHSKPDIMRPALLEVIDKPWLTVLAYLRQQGLPLGGLYGGTL